MPKCEFRDEAMKGLREDIHDVKECVERIEKTLYDNGGGGLIFEIKKNTEYRKQRQSERTLEAGKWRSIIPNVVTTIITVIVIGILMVILPNLK